MSTITDRCRATVGSFRIGQLFWFVVVCSWLRVVEASTSQTGGKSYNVYNFDQTTPQFTPDGRLLQVEYASSAAERSTPLVALTLPLPLETEGDEQVEVSSSLQRNYEQALVLISVQPLKSKPATMEKNGIHNREKDGTDPRDEGESTPPIFTACHNRLVIIPSSHNDFPNNDGRRSNNCRDIVVAMSGVLADCVALLQKVWDQASRNYQLYQTHLSCVQVAQELADACQVHSFGGGIRPFGSTMLICGMNDGSNSENVRHTIMQTDPSGAILVVPGHSTLPQGGSPTTENTSPSSSSKPKNHRWFRRLGNNKRSNNNSYVRWIAGGTSSQKRQLESRLEQELGQLIFSMSRSRSAQKKESADVPTSVLLDGIAIAVRAMIQGQQGQQPLYNNNSNNNEKKASTMDVTNPPSTLDRRAIEVVVMSSTLGVFRLSEKHLDAVLTRANELVNQ